MAGNRNRVRSEVAKGVEALRAVDIHITGDSTFVIGPFETDIDIKSVLVGNSAAVSAGSLTITNNGVTNAIVAQTSLVNATAYSNLSKTINPAYARLKAGNVGVVVVNGSYATGPGNIRIGYDVPVYDPTAQYTTYGSYDDGI